MKKLITEWMVDDPDAMIKPVIPFTHSRTAEFDEPVRVWKALGTLSEMWNNDEEEEYNHYVQHEWEEVL